MFENNSIKKSVSISLMSLSKNVVVGAVAENLEEVRDLFRQYIEKGGPSEFFVKIAGNIYDVFVDSTAQAEKPVDLKKVLADCRAIIKIVDGKVDGNWVTSLSNSLTAHAMHWHRNNAVGHTVMVRREVSLKGYSGRVKDMPPIEKP